MTAFEAAGRYYLGLANFNSVQVRGTDQSDIYVLNASGKFELFDQIESHTPHVMEAFTVAGRTFLGVANSWAHGTAQEKAHTHSDIYVLNSEQTGFDHVDRIDTGSKSASGMSAVTAGAVAPSLASPTAITMAGLRRQGRPR